MTWRPSGDVVELPRHLVDRSDLLARLDQVPESGVGVVIAPAGSGKSVLLAEWLASDRVGRSCLMQLDATMDDPVLLGRHLAAALAATAPELEFADSKLRSMPYSTSWIEVLADLREPLDIVVDDLHHLHDDRAVAVFGELASGLPAPARLIVASRSDPPIPLHRLRVTGRLIELRQADLAFTQLQATPLVEAVSGRHLTDEQVEKLVAHTDGWVAGLQLAAISLQTAEDVGVFIDGFTGSNRLVAEYLTAEVIAEQSEDVREFLTATCVLDELDAEVCDAVVGRADSGRYLLDLEARGLFLIPIGESGTRFRYHHLFADLLRYTVRANDREAERQARLRAADWYRSHGDAPAAIDQLIAADETGAAFELVLSDGLRAYETGQGYRMCRWMEAIASRSAESVMIDLSLLMTQIAADEWVGGLETSRRLGRREDLTPDEAAIAASYRAGLGHYDLAAHEVIAAAEEASVAIENMDGDLDLFGLTDPASLTEVSQTLSALAYFHIGDFDESLARFDDGSRSGRAQYPLWTAHTMASKALVLAWTGHLREANRLAESALGLATELGNSEHKAIDDARVAKALITLEGGDLAECAEWLHLARRLAIRCRRTAALEALGVIRSRFEARSKGADAGLAAVRGDPTATSLRPLFEVGRRRLEADLLLATGEAAEADRLLSSLPDWPGLAPSRIQLALSEGDTALAHRLAEHWVPPEVDLRSYIDRALCLAAIRSSQDLPEEARRFERAAAAAAEAEGFGLGALERHAVAAAEAPLVVPLTEREASILPYLPTRLSNQDLADELFVSVNTVKTHLSSIYRKLGVADRNHAVERATELGLL